jgi:hypothetical protein
MGILCAYTGGHVWIKIYFLSTNWKTNVLALALFLWHVIAVVQHPNCSNGLCCFLTKMASVVSSCLLQNVLFCC